MRSLELPLRLDSVRRSWARSPSTAATSARSSSATSAAISAASKAAGARRRSGTRSSPSLSRCAKTASAGYRRRDRDANGRGAGCGDVRFLAGVYQGLGSAGVPVVGVEPTRVEQSAIPVFQRHQLSTVDGVDTPVGALAALLVLADPDAAGDYGVRDTADRLLPPIEPLPAEGG